MNVRSIAIAVMIAAGLAALIASGSSKPGGSGGGHHKTSVTHGGSAAKDVTITSCTTVNGRPTAKVKIVNHSSKTSNYIVAVAFDSSDGSIHYRSSLSSSAKNVAPGQTIQRNAAAIQSSSSSGKFTCKVSSVTRFAS